MPRLNEKERQDLMSDINGHYEELLVLHPGWQIDPDANFGLPELRALEDAYTAKSSAIDSIVASGMPAKRAQRDAIFGTSSDDPDALWGQLKLYKGNARLDLTRNASRIDAKSLISQVPNIGNVSPGAYISILTGFINHWTLVNAALPPAKPLTIGTLTLADLEAKRAQLQTLIAGIDETVLTRLAVLRAEREQLFGDVSEEQRENDSLIAYFQAYEIEVETQFPGPPLATTLPQIFPGEAVLPRFPFNHRQSGSDVIVWFTPPADIEASIVFLKEGAFEETVAIPSAAPFKVEFQGVAIVEGIDEVELRDSSGKTLAHGKFDGSLIEPI